MNENKTTSKCYIIGLKSYQNIEFEYIDRIINNGYAKYAVLDDVPIIVELKDKEACGCDMMSESSNDLSHVSYCAVPQTVNCIFGGDETPIDIFNGKYNKSLIPGWFGKINPNSLLDGDVLLYHKVEVNYKTSNQRIMPLTLCLSLGRTIAYDLLREVFNKFDTTYTEKDENNDIKLTDEGALLLGKVKYCVDIIEKHYGGCIMVESKFSKMLDRVVESSKEDAFEGINVLCGIKDISDTDFKSSANLIAQVLSYVQAAESRNASKRIELVKYFTDIDTGKLQEMNNVTKINDKKNKLIEKITNSGKLEEYKSLYQEYFDKLKEAAVEKAKVLEDHINVIIGHVIAKEQISVKEIEELYDATLELSYLADKNNRPKEVTDILKKIRKLSASTNEVELTKLKSLLKAEKNNCIVGLCNTKLNDATLKN